MIYINEYKKDFKMFVDKAKSLLDEEKNDDAIRFYRKAIISLENLMKFDENKYNNQFMRIRKKK